MYSPITHLSKSINASVFAMTTAYFDESDSATASVVSGLVTTTEKWKAFEYGQIENDRRSHTAHIQQRQAKQGSKRAPTAQTGPQGENAKRIQIATNSLA